MSSSSWKELAFWAIDEMAQNSIVPFSQGRMALPYELTESYTLKNPDADFTGQGDSAKHFVNRYLEEYGPAGVIHQEPHPIFTSEDKTVEDYRELIREIYQDVLLKDSSFGNIDIQKTDEEDFSVEITVERHPDEVKKKMREVKNTDLENLIELFNDWFAETGAEKRLHKIGRSSSEKRLTLTEMSEALLFFGTQEQKEKLEEVFNRLEKNSS
jgi:hypothetical protein